MYIFFLRMSSWLVRVYGILLQGVLIPGNLGAGGGQMFECKLKAG